MMMDIPPLKVSSVKREQGKAVITLSSGEIRIMPRAMLKERPYKSGMQFDDQAFIQFLAERSYSFAMDKAVFLLSMRSRTEKEIVEALRRSAYPEESIARVMQRLIEAGYIDDISYANQYSAARLSKGVGARRIRVELRKKGVDSDTIDETIQALNDDDILSGAIKVANKAAHGKDLGDRSDQQKILAALARRGYDYTTAKAALSALLNNESMP